MYNMNFQQFKIRYLIITFVVLMAVMVGIVISTGGNQQVSDVTQLALGAAMTLYMLWQTKVKNITYNSITLQNTLSKKRWGKYIGMTIATKLYAQLIVVVFSTAVMVLFFDFIQTVIELLGVLPVATADASIFYYVSLFISICILAPIWEELFFRGILLRRLFVKWRAPASLIVSSIIFGLFHLNAGQVVYATILGLLFGYVYLRTENIIVPMILHSVANFLSFISLVFVDVDANAALEQVLSLDKGELTSQLLYLTIAAVISTIILAIIGMKKYRIVKTMPKLKPIGQEVVSFVEERKLEE